MSSAICRRRQCLRQTMPGRRLCRYHHAMRLWDHPLTWLTGVWLTLVVGLCVLYFGGCLTGCVAVPRGAAVGIDVDGVDRVLQYIDQRIPATPTGQGDLIGLFLSGAALYGGNQARKWFRRRNGKIGKAHAQQTQETFDGASK